MTKVTIDIRNIASSTHADDRVFFRAPVVREAPSGGLVNTANEVVTLTDGVGDVELTPGPVIVTFQCKGVADTSPKRGTVPDSGTVELSQVISGSFSYSPEVVTAAQAARDDAQDAAGQAKDYRDAAETAADEASTASSTAVSSASTAVTKADEAAASASTATTAASSASTSASQAATSRDQAAQSATDAAAALDTKADKVHTHTTAQVTGLDTALADKADKVDVQNNLGDVAGLLAGWTADAIGGRNYFSYTYMSNLENWNRSTYYISKEVIQLEPDTEYTFHAEEVTADTQGEWTVLNLMDGTDGVLPWSISNPNRLSSIYNRNKQAEPQPVNVTFTAPSSGKIYFEFYSNGKFGEDAKPFWLTEKLVRAQIVRGREVPEWRPSPEDAVWDYLPNGESVSPFLPGPIIPIRVDNSVGTRVFAGDTMIHGDTGLRDITHLVSEPWRTPATYAYIRRYNGNQVDLVLYNLTHAASETTTIIDLPDGFGGVKINAMPRVLFHTASATTFRTYFSTTKRLSSLTPNPVNGSQSFGSTTYSTNDAWPASLPGLPA